MTHLAFLLVIASSAAACLAVARPAPDGPAAEVLDRVFIEADVAPFAAPFALANEIDTRHFLGTSDHPPIVDSAVARDAMGVEERIVFVLRTDGDRAAFELAERIDQSLDPDGPLAVRFTRGDLRIDRRGDVVFVVIDADPAERNALVDAFGVIE